MPMEFKLKQAGAVLAAALLALSAESGLAAVTAAPTAPLPEEVTITGSSDLLQLRKQLLQAEKRAYDVFNRFNDEKRFRISCSMHQPTGTRLEQQVCQAAFELEASQAHARVFVESLCDVLCFGRADGQSHTVHVPQEILIASQLDAYKRKLRQIAEQHPEFLEALIEYTRLREDYTTATGRQTP